MSGVTFHEFAFRAYGVSVSVASNNRSDTEKFVHRLRSNFPVMPEQINPDDARYRLRLQRNPEGKDELTVNGDFAGRQVNNEELFDALAALARLAVAEHAPDHSFVHAGVVSWNGNGIVIPGRSMSGKTTLVAAFLEAGAEYFSDEFAIISADGLIHPFAKPLSMRLKDGDRNQTDHAPESLGARVGSDPVRARIILVTEYASDAVWNPVVESAGTGIMELMKNSVGIRAYPDRTLAFLSAAARQARVVRSPRADAREAVAGVLTMI